MQCFKRQRLSLERDTAIEPDAPDPTDNYELNYEQELAAFDAIPEEEQNPEEEEHPEDEREPVCPEPLDLAALWAYHFDYHALGN